MTRLSTAPLTVDRHPIWDVLIVEVDPDAAVRLAAFLRAEGHRPRIVPTVADAQADLRQRSADLICLTLDPPGGVGGEAVRKLRSLVPTADVVIVAAPADAERVLQAVRHGAADHLPAPVTPAAVELLLTRLEDRRRMGAQLRTARAELDDDPDADLPTESTDVRHLFAIGQRVAGTHAPVLIVGEPGTGKGRWARAIHGWSGRAAGPIAIVPCATTDPDALDAELFGNAGGDVHGHVGLCRGGTLVLDRVGELPLSLQPKLLRLIADRQYERRDDPRSRPADVRVVATTADDLVTSVRAGRFREDLRLALDVVRLDLPALRDRARDLPLLAERYLVHAARQFARPVIGFTPDAVAVLARHRWPGNLRELRNVVERAVMIAPGERIGPADLPADIRNTVGDDGLAAHMPGDLVSLRTIEDQHIRRVLATVGNARAAAAVLGIDPSTLWRRMRPRSDPQPTA